MIRRILIFLIRWTKERREKTVRDGVFCAQGSVVYCAKCKEIIRYIPVMLPIEVPEAKDQFGISYETKYQYFHNTCAMLELSYRAPFECVNRQQQQ